MKDKPMRVLVIGGDASTWLGLSSALGKEGSQIFVPKDVSLFRLTNSAGDIDVVVSVIPPDDPEALSHLGFVKDAGLARRTLVVADRDDRQSAGAILALGVAGYVTRGSSPQHLATAITHIAAGGVFYDAPLAEMLGNGRPSENATTMTAAARALAYALELKDTYTGGHAERVSALALRIADAALIEDALPSPSLEAAFLLHDVGKIGIPESILGKPGGLTDTERRVLQTHPILGERIIAPLGFPECVRQVVRHHHERWDGRGYPDGLSGEDIPGSARIFSIADVLDAMTSVRPYRKPISFEEAMAEILRNAGKQFDPNLCAVAEAVFLEAPIELLEASSLFDT